MSFDHAAYMRAYNRAADTVRRAHSIRRTDMSFAQLRRAYREEFKAALAAERAIEDHNAAIIEGLGR